MYESPLTFRDVGLRRLDEPEVKTQKDQEPEPEGLGGFRFDLSTLSLGNVLGHGAFAVVHIGRLGDKDVAVKQLDRCAHATNPQGPCYCWLGGAT